MWKSLRTIKKAVFKNVVLISVPLWIVAALLTGALYQKVASLQKTKLQPKVESAATTQTLPANVPTYTPQPIQEPVTQTFIPTSTSDPDPFITCNYQHIASRTLRRSDCNKSTACQIGNSWIWYATVDACKKDQNALVQNQPPVQTSNSNWTPYPTISYVSCTLFYPTTGVYKTYNTLYTNSQDCTNAQLQINSEAQQYLNSLPVPTTKPDNSQQNAACKAQAKQWYDNQIAQYGESSAGEAASSILLPQYQTQVQLCDSQYPL